MERVRLKVFGLSYKSMSFAGAYALVLAEEHDAFRIPIIIGMAEAQSIAIQLEHLDAKRPLTHDLLKHLADQLGVVLEEVFIYHWKSGIFYAELSFRRGEEILKIDSRTSDAIALALRYDCPIYISADVVSKTSIPFPDLRQGESTGKAQEPVEDEVAFEVKFSVEELMRLMNEAVKNEDYETASRFRDMLKKRK